MRLKNTGLALAKYSGGTCSGTASLSCVTREIVPSPLVGFAPTERDYGHPSGRCFFPPSVLIREFQKVPPDILFRNDKVD